MTKLDKLISSKIFFYDDPKRSCDKYFDKLTEISSEDRFKNGKRLDIKKSEKSVSYDSPYEKKIIEDFDKCSFINKIKTQSLVIDYKSTMFRTRKYYPDIQLLLSDGIIAIIEVKPFKEMVNKHNLEKHKELAKYCKKHKFGFAIIDCDYYSFEDLKREKVSINTQKKFIKYVKDRGSITFDECDEFKKEYNINDYQICNIILNNSNQIIYQQHLIKYVI